MSTLGTRIRHARENLGWLQMQLGDAVGVSGAVISNWEKDLNKPDVEKLIRLCGVLRVAPSWLLDCWEGQEGFSLEEWELVRKYRVLDLHGRTLTGLVLDAEYLRMTKGGEEREERTDNVTYLRYFDLAVSAGTGEPLEDSFSERRMSFPTDLVPENAHYCVRVNGDSMEPAYRDGDVVFVERTDGLVQEGEVGIFILNGEGFIKRLGSGELLSLNPRYAPIPIRDFDDLRCQGRVLGRC